MTRASSARLLGGSVSRVPRSARRTSRLSAQSRSACQSPLGASVRSAPPVDSAPPAAPVDSALRPLSPPSARRPSRLSAPVRSGVQAPRRLCRLDPSPLDAQGLELGGYRYSEARVLVSGLIGWRPAVVSRETAPACRPPIAAASWSVKVSRRRVNAVMLAASAPATREAPPFGQLSSPAEPCRRGPERWPRDRGSGIRTSSKLRCGVARPTNRL